jgi:tyrosine-protein phosphatase YwqE
VFHFLRSAKKSTLSVKVDLHSHLLAGIDDGARSWKESILLIEALKEIGFTHAITTPHIRPEHYPNTPELILAQKRYLLQLLAEKKINFTVEAAAEYYLDETLMNQMDGSGSFLTFGKKCLLFELNHLQEPFFLKDFIFKASIQGYKLVLAHPERYLYLDESRLEDLRDRGVLFQINTLSLGGMYGKPTQRVAERLIDRQWIDWIGTDCHHAENLPWLKKAISNRYYSKALSLPLLNYSHTW